MTVIATEEMIMIAIETEDVITIVMVKEIEGVIAIVIEEMIAVGKEMLLVAVTAMNLFRQEPLVDSKIRALVVVRIRTSRMKGETSFMAFPEFNYSTEYN